MERRIDDQRPSAPLEWEAKHAAMDRAGELPLERRVAERRKEPPALVTVMASTIVALKERLKSAHDEAFEQIATMTVELDTVNEDDAAFLEGVSYGIGKYRRAIRALASQPATPVQPLSHEFEELRKLAMAALEHGDMIGEDDWYSCDENMSIFAPNPDLSLIAAANPATILRLIALAAPPVQQPGDVPIGADSLAEILRDTADNPVPPLSEKEMTDICTARGWASGAAPSFRDIALVFWVNGALAERQAIATTRPSAALTDEQEAALRDAMAEHLSDLYHCGRVWSAWGVGTMSEDDFSIASEDDDIVENFVSAAKSILAASSGAVAVPDAVITGKDSGCRMQGGICACRSGGSYGGCVRDRESCCAAAPAIPAQGQTK